MGERAAQASSAHCHPSGRSRWTARDCRQCRLARTGELPFSGDNSRQEKYAVDLELQQLRGVSSELTKMTEVNDGLQ